MASPRRSHAAHIRVCGTLIAEIGGRRVESSLPGRKGRQLFACLVIDRHRPMSRDELIDAIWHAAPPADPDGTFSTLLTRLRMAVGREVVIGRSELMLDLGEDPWVDWEVARDSVGAAEAMLATGDAPGALALATGALEISRHPLLAGVSTPWLEARRRELAETSSALLETKGRAALRMAGDHLPTAERSARELIAFEPYRESGYALLMEAHAASGNVAEALRVYDDLRRLLREELGLTPAPAVTELAARLLEQKQAAPEPTGGRREASAAGMPPAAAPLPPAIAAIAARPLAGRDAEARRLAATVRGLPADRYHVVAITGDAGVGKTRLAAEVAARAHGQGCEVLHGRVQRAAVTPYQPFVEAVRGHLAHSDEVARELAPVLAPELGELARFVPEMRSVIPVAIDDLDDGARRRRICDAFAALCEALARRRPLLVVLDDVQWADTETLLVLRHIARSAPGARVTVLVTLRDDEPLGAELREVLLDLLRDRALERVPLRELDEAATAELIAAHGRGTCPASEVRTIRVQAGGNPFLIEELLRGDGADAALPAGLRDAVAGRLERLPSAALEILGAAAAAGRSFDLPAVARRADAAPAEVSDAIGLAVRAGVVVADPRGADGFAFRLDIVRQALLA